jgi:hypothetical protein
MNHQRLNRHFKEGQRRAEENRRRLHEGFFAQDGYSAACVMQSAAGYYLGSLAWCVESWGSYWCPGTRDSGYYATAQEVRAAFPWALSMQEAVDQAGTEFASGPATFMPRKTVDYMFAHIPVVNVEYVGRYAEGQRQAA